MLALQLQPYAVALAALAAPAHGAAVDQVEPPAAGTLRGDDGTLGRLEARALVEHAEVHASAVEPHLDLDRPGHDAGVTDRVRDQFGGQQAQILGRTRA